MDYKLTVVKPPKLKLLEIRRLYVLSLIQITMEISIKEYLINKTKNTPTLSIIVMHLRAYKFCREFTLSTLYKVKGTK